MVAGISLALAASLALASALGARPGRVATFVGVLVGVTGFLAPRPPLHRLTGPRDVAVAGFKGHGPGQNQRVLDDVSATFAHDLSKVLKDTTVRNYTRDYSLPLTELLHRDRHSLETRTRKFIDQSNAAIPLGGIVTSGDAGQTLVQPAVYVRADQVPDAPELAGWYTSEPLPMDAGWQSAYSRTAMVSELVQRAQGLTEFTSALDAWRQDNAVAAP